MGANCRHSRVGIGTPVALSSEHGLANKLFRCQVGAIVDVRSRDLQSGVLSAGAIVAPALRRCTYLLTARDRQILSQHPLTNEKQGAPARGALGAAPRRDVSARSGPHHVHRSACWRLPAATGAARRAGSRTGTRGAVNLLEPIEIAGRVKNLVHIEKSLHIRGESK